MGVTPIVLVIAMLIGDQHAVTVQALPAGMCKDFAARAASDSRVQSAACLRDDGRLTRAIEAAACEAMESRDSYTTYVCERSPAWPR